MTSALSPVRAWRLWLVWGVGVAAYVLSVTNRTSLSAVGVDAAVRFDADASTLSLFAVVQLAVYGAMQIPVGLLLDRFGARPLHKRCDVPRSRESPRQRVTDNRSSGLSLVVRRTTLLHP